jgi:hypothetical protein
MQNFHTIRQAVSGFIALFILTASWISPAQAEKNCDIFASDAIKQIKQAKKLGCGFTGSLWDDNYNGHKNWCFRANISEQILINTYFTRQRALDKCKKNKSGGGSQSGLKNGCKAFAQRAVKKARLNKKLRCGYKTGNYADDYNGHFNWCMKKGVLAASHADKVTNLGIAKCRKASKNTACKKAATRTQGWRQALATACEGVRGISGSSEWPANWEDDYADCKKRGTAWIDRKNKNRKNLASRCVKKKNTKTFTSRGKLRHNTGRYGWLPFDGCSNRGPSGAAESLWAICGKPWATEICKRFGYKKAIAIKTATNDQRASKWGVKADRPSTWWVGSKSICHGRCSYFRTITCTR